MWAALAPDGNLSSFEQRLLEVHVERCAECASFAAGVGATTTLLRNAALVELPYPITVRPRRRRVATTRFAPVAAAAAVVLLTLSLGSIDVRPKRAPQGEALVIVAQPSDNRAELREMQKARRAQLVDQHVHIAVDRFRPGVHS